MSGNILVTGGAGYIGSHTVKALLEQGESVVVLDNLYSGFRSAVTDECTFIEGNVGNQELVDRILHDHQIESVLHFAAHTVVPESVSNPLKYYQNNTANTRNLIECCVNYDVKHFVFSSTAAVYGMPGSGTASEESPLSPINPYGTSKLMSEMMLRDASVAHPLRHIVLRYFNVAGSAPDGSIGQSTREATLLIKVACEAAIGKREQLYIFGTDYPTPDGTGIRDYIHVSDLADAHLKALEYLRSGGDSTTLNCGYGHGYSVREVIDTLNKLIKKPVTVIETDRREGDPPSLVAKADRIRELLNWTPQYDDLGFIIETSLKWEKHLLENPVK